MFEWLVYEWNFHMWAVVACGAALIASLSIWADWRRNKNRQVGRVSYMPWTALSMLAVGVTLLAAALAVKSG